MNENKTSEIAYYLTASIIVFLISFFYSREIQEVKNRYDVLQEEKTSLVKEYQALEKENGTLKQIIEDNEYVINNKDTRCSNEN